MILYSPRVPVFADTGDESYEGAEHTLYQIKLLQVKQLLQAGFDIESSENGADIKLLISDAVSMAEQELYALAVDFLNSALDLIQMQPPGPAETPTFPEARQPSPWQWDLIALSGSEIWRQSFGLVLEESDSTIYDNQTNPYTGVRLLMEYGKSEKMTGQVQVEGKISRDYFALHSNAELVNQFSSSLKTRITNEFDRYVYQQESGFDYTDNSLEAGLFYMLNPRVMLSVSDDFELRLYDHEDAYFPGYRQNRVEVSSEFRLEPVGRLTATFGDRIRRHVNVPERDYNEYTLGFRLWPELYTRFSFSDMFNYYSRSFEHGFVDSLYTNDYGDIYNLLDLGYILYGQTSMKCRFEIESRRYAESVSSMPDYTDYSLEPGVEFNIIDNLTLQAGYRFRNRLHSLDNGQDASVDVEDYYTHGPVFTLDFVMGSGFIASISNSYQLQRYPNYVGYDDSGISLYSNRNINSVFFFLTWNISPAIEFNSMGMLDYDTDQDLAGAKTTSNLLNFELLYKF